MHTITRSIKGRLFIWFFLFTSILLIIFGIALQNEIKQVVYSSIDRTLHAKMQILTGLLHEEHGILEFELSEVIHGDYSIPRSGHYYKVLSDEKLINASPSLVDSNFNFTSNRRDAQTVNPNEMIYITTGPYNEPLRVLEHQIELNGIPATIFVAESLKNSLDMIDRFRRFQIIAIPAIIFIGGLVGYFIVKKSLQPLNTFSATIENITHKTLEERIESSSVAIELSSLTSSFNAMLYRLQKSFETQNRIISDASHELRTPVSVIRSSCDVMLLKERSKGEYIEALNTIKTVSESMSKLITDLLSLARLESGVLSPSDFRVVSLNLCIEKALQVTKSFIEHKQITAKVLLAEDINIMGDDDRLTEALLNIIENAIKYNKSQGIIEITANRKEGLVVISIKDSGVGIQEHDLQHIFEPFYRADESRSTEGTGLGLNIAKTIIEAYNGKIYVESSFGQGSIFTVIFPEVR